MNISHDLRTYMHTCGSNPAGRNFVSPDMHPSSTFRTLPLQQGTGWPSENLRKETRRLILFRWVTFSILSTFIIYYSLILPFLLFSDFFLIKLICCAKL